MGTGVLWARQATLDAMPPYQLGSNMAHEVDATSAQFEHGALKYQAGTPNVAGAVGLSAAVEVLERFDLAAISRHDSATGPALSRARRRRCPAFACSAPSTIPTSRVPVFTFTLPGVPVAAIVKALDNRGVAVRAGDMAALPLLRRFGRQRGRARVVLPLYDSRGNRPPRRRPAGASPAGDGYLNGNSFTAWHVPQAAVYGMGIARPGAPRRLPRWSSRARRTRGTSTGPANRRCSLPPAAVAYGGVLIILPKSPAIAAGVGGAGHVTVDAAGQLALHLGVQLRFHVRQQVHRDGIAGTTGRRSHSRRE